MTLVGGFLLPSITFGKRFGQLLPFAEEPFVLPELAYDFAALEPNMDEATMRVHHGKHHAGYVAKLNEAIRGSRFSGRSIRQVMPMLQSGDTAIRNNGGGHFNHSLFWKILTPNKGTKVSEALGKAIELAFGNMETMKTQLLEAGKTRFGSGWAWLAVDKNGKLFISSTPNQDNPLMYQLVDRPGYPILGIDLWEHAYYLKYKNMRADYLEAVWQILNWEEISKQFGMGNHPFILWHDLDEFHNVMAATFHPMEEGDLNPIRTRSKELASSAKMLLKSNIPARFDTPELRSSLKKLSKDSVALDNLVRQPGSNEAITASLTALHEVFHSIIGICMDEK